MSTSNRTSSSLASASMGSTGVEATQAETTALRDSDDSEAISLFDRAVVEAMRRQECKAEEVAAQLGVSYQHLSDFRNGKRTIALHRAVRIARKDTSAALALAQFFAALAGKRLAGKERPQKPHFLQQLALDLQKNPALLELVIPNTAKKFEMTAEEAKEFLDEPTGIPVVDMTYRGALPPYCGCSEPVERNRCTCGRCGQLVEECAA